MSRMMGAVIGLAVMMAMLTGCQSNDPCAVIRNSPGRWTCNLDVVEPLVPGDIIYRDGDQLVKLPVQTGNTQDRETRLADVIGQTSWSFGLDAGLAEIPGLADVQSPKLKLENAGVEKINMKFSDNALVRSLDATADDVEKARAAAQRFLNNFDLDTRNELGQQLADKKDVWLVMQTLNAGVEYVFVTANSTGAQLGATIEGIASSVNGSVANSQQKSLSFSQPLSIAYRALPLKVEKASLEAPAAFMAADTRTWSQPGPVKRTRR